MCCDVCAEQCYCTSCVVHESVNLYEEDLATFLDFSAHENEELCYTKRESKLQQLQSHLLSAEPASALIGPGILCGLTNATMRSIVKNCLQLKSTQDVQSLGITSLVHAEQIYDIISTFQFDHRQNDEDEGMT